MVSAIWTAGSFYRLKSLKKLVRCIRNRPRRCQDHLCTGTPRMSFDDYMKMREAVKGRPADSLDLGPCRVMCVRAGRPDRTRQTGLRLVIAVLPLILLCSIIG